MHGDAPDIDKFVDDLCAALGRSRDEILSVTSARSWAPTPGPRVIGLAYDELGS